MDSLSVFQRQIMQQEKLIGGAVNTVGGYFLMNNRYSEEDYTAALNCLFKNNDILRANFFSVDGEDFQEVMPFEEKKVKFIYFENKAELSKWMENETKNPLNYATEPCDIRIGYAGNQSGLLFRVHHLVCDAWAVSLIGSFVSDYVNKRDVFCSNYLKTIKKNENSRNCKKDADFFMDEIHQCDEIVLLNDKKVTDFSVKRKTFNLEKKIVSKISSFAEEKNVSIYEILFTAFGILYNRITNYKDNFFLGTSFLNRFGKEEKKCIGMFVSVCPIFFSFKSEDSFLGALTKTKNIIAKTFRHHRFTYGEVLSEIRKEDRKFEKLYDVTFNYQNAQMNQNVDYETRWFCNGKQAESLCVHVDDRDRTGGLTFNFDYQVEKFTNKEIEYLYESYATLLDECVSAPDTKICEIDIVSKNQKLILNNSNDSENRIEILPVHCVFENEVRNHPGKNALFFGEKKFTYSELDFLAEELCGKIKEKGIKKGDVVGILAHRDYRIVVAMLAVSKAGGVFVAIDSNYPWERINFIIEDSGCKLILKYQAEYDFENTIDLENEIKIENQSDFTELTKRAALSEKAEKNHSEIGIEDGFAIIYTSGSTGNPKGTLLTHKGIVNQALFCKNFYGECKVQLGFAIFTFDAFIYDQINPLLNGVESVMATEEEIYNQECFERLFEKFSDVYMFSTPTKFKQYIYDSKKKDFLKKIKVVTFGGEKVSEEMLALLPKNIVAYNLYGPSECSMFSTWKIINKKENIESIGKPIFNTKIHILDKYGKEMPVNVDGEICISGFGVGKGYINRTELNNSKFVENPFGEGLLYHSGDVAHWDTNGEIIFKGRKDNQIKLRGLRIELDEIELKIKKISGIENAVVLVKKDDENHEVLCAFYSGKETDEKKLRNELKKSLPQYMIPNYFMYLQKMPVTASGKINRKQLPDRIEKNDVSKKFYNPPETEFEKKVVNLLEKTLNLKKISLNDNFFELGGDSLKAIEFISYLADLNLNLEIKNVFDSETILELINAITYKKDKSEISLVIENKNHLVPASPRQKVLFEVYKNNFYDLGANVLCAYECKGFEPKEFENALNKVIARHESLRTVFSEKNGEIFQVIKPNLEIKIEKISLNSDFSNLNDYNQPFNLEKGPLVRAFYDKNVLLFGIHHSITDGCSMSIILDEINTFLCGRTPDYEAVPFRQCMPHQKDFNSSKQFWLSQFKEPLPELSLKGDLIEPETPNYEGKSVFLLIPDELTEKIQKCSLNLKTTTFQYCMTAYALLDAYLFNQEDIIFATALNCRTPKNRYSVGFYTNSLPMRFKLKKEKSVKSIFEEVKTATKNALEYPYLILKDFTEELKTDCIYKNGFFYEDAKMIDFKYKDVYAKMIPTELLCNHYDFDLSIFPSKNQLNIMLDYRVELYTPLFVQKMLDKYLQILQLITDENITVENVLSKLQ